MTSGVTTSINRDGAYFEELRDDVKLYRDSQYRGCLTRAVSWFQFSVLKEDMLTVYSPPTHRGRFISPGFRLNSSENPRERFNIADRTAHSVKFDKDAIIEAANDNECYHFRRYKLHNLPKFDDCKPYAAGSDDLNKLFNDEVEKLIEFAELDQPPLFSSHGCLRGTDRKDFEELSNLADQLLCITDVLTHDNSRHGVTFGSHVAAEAWDSLIASRGSLRTRYAKAEKHVEGGQPVTLDDCGQSERNARALHLLLDYILNTMVWWLVRCADSKYWRTQILATLAQWAVKMKIISRDPGRFAESSLSATSGMIEQLKIEADANDVLIKIGGKKKDVSSIQAQTDYCNLYIEEKLWIRDALRGILTQILLALAQDDKSTTPADLFEVCTMVFRRDTEPDRSGKMWTGMRHGDVGVSSGLDHISYCYSLKDMLNLHNNTLMHAQKPPQSKPDEYIRLRGYVYEDGNTIPYNLTVYSMDHAITLLAPLLLIQPLIIKQIPSLMNGVIPFMDAKETLRVFNPPPNDFALELTLSTSAWLRDSKTPRVLDADITSLSNSPLNREHLCKVPRYSWVFCANGPEQIQAVHNRLGQPDWNVYGTSTPQSSKT
jgi:hypothetical protein